MPNNWQSVRERTRRHLPCTVHKGIPPIQSVREPVRLDLRCVSLCVAAAAATRSIPKGYLYYRLFHAVIPGLRDSLQRRNLCSRKQS